MSDFNTFTDELRAATPFAVRADLLDYMTHGERIDRAIYRSGAAYRALMSMDARIMGADVDGHWHGPLRAPALPIDLCSACQSWHYSSTPCSA